MAVVADEWGDPLSYTTTDGWISIQSLKPNHLYTYPISSPQVADPVYPMPFPVTVEARDVLGNVLTSYATSLSMYDVTGTIAPVVVQMANGVWSGDMTLGMPIPTDTLWVLDGSYPDVWAVSNGFQVIGLGDVNADDTVNVLDVVKILNFALGKLAPTSGWQSWAADIDCSQSIDVLDVLLAVNLALGQQVYSESFAPLSASATVANRKEKPVRVSLRTRTTRDGLVVSEVTLDKTAALAGIQVDLDYDASTLTFVSAELGAVNQAADGWTLGSHAQNGRARLIAYNARLRALGEGSGSVLVATFSRAAAKGKVPDPSLAAALLGDSHGAQISSELK